jgi:hypothetical protein
MEDDLFASLPRELILHIISFYPTNYWFLLSKRFYELAFEAMPSKFKHNALLFACNNGMVPLVERCLKVKFTYKGEYRDCIGDCIVNTVATDLDRLLQC